MDVATPNRYLFNFFYNFSKPRNSTAVCVCKILATLEIFFFARFQRITFKLSKITSYLLSSGVDGFSVTSTCQKLKKTVVLSRSI